MTPSQAIFIFLGLPVAICAVVTLLVLASTSKSAKRASSISVE